MTKKDIGKIMTQKFDPRAIAREQHDAYRQYILDVLKDVTEKVAKGDFTAVADMTVFSPAGDCMGWDNHFINFGYDNRARDILEALNRLAYLERYADGEFDLDENYCSSRDYIGLDEN